MKEPVTILIPVFNAPLTAVAMNSLATVQAQLGEFPITFIKGESFTQVEELAEFCPSADFVSFDDRYFSSRTGYAKLLLGRELYDYFGWSRYLLICEMNTVITKNELAYWCRQGYDFIQPYPHFTAPQPLTATLTKRITPQTFLQNNLVDFVAFGHSSGISLRSNEAFQKLTKRKRRDIQGYLASASDVVNDALFWELYTNRWWPDLNTPTVLSRNRFAQSATFAASRRGESEKPFAISGLIRPLPAPENS